MPTMISPGSRLAAALILASPLALAACEVRKDGPPEESDVPAPETSASPPADPTAPVSIIREDIATPEAIALPPEPVDTVLPFPDGAALTPAAERLLEEVIESPALAEGWPVTLGGHTDSSGNDRANIRAARARAEAVAAWLVEHGVADERIEVIAFGEQNPIAPNALPDGTPNEEGRRTNRRVELRIAPPIRKTPENSEAVGVPEREGA